MRPPLPETLPRPTYTPAVAALGIMLLAWGVVSSVVLIALGAALLAVGLGRWFGEIRRGD